MKIRSSKYWEEKGSIFIVALGMTAVSALVAGTYLVMVEGQADSVARSQCFGSAITGGEAGVEEALAMVNQSYPTNGNDMSWTNTLVTNGWGAWTSTNTTTKSNLVFSGSYYKVIISNAPGGTPYITSVGVVPYVQNAWGSSLETPDTNGTSSTVALIRTIQVSTSTSTTTSIFGSGVASTGDITFSGGATVDSFNSLNPLLSSNGQY